MSHKFIGGVRVRHNLPKVPVEPAMRLAPPSQVVVPMSLHIGKPCTPCVAVGDHVDMGQLIGEAGGPVSAPIHSPVSGTVAAVEPRLISLGFAVPSVIIDNDGQDTLYSGIRPHPEAENDPDELVRVVREAGIVGMGGATFPTAFKISSGWGKVETVIVNGAECEPGIASDYRAMLDHPQELLRGIGLVMMGCKVSEATLVIEDNKPEAIANLTALLPADGSIKLMPVPVRYPQGAEKQLINTVTGREVPPGKLPADVGCSVFNVETCLAVENAVRTGMPLIERYCTVSGTAAAEPRIMLVRIGTPVSCVFEAAGGFKCDPVKVVMGGPMMGMALFDLSVPCTKGTNGLLAFAEDATLSAETGQCIRCGRCVEACPVRLLPTYLFMFTNRGAMDKLEEYHVSDCIECGCCTYGCPARLPLTQTFKLGKARLRNYQAAQKAKAEKEAAK